MPTPAGSRLRRRARFRLLTPVVVSLLTQLPVAVWLLRRHVEAGPILLATGVAAALVLLGARRWPGPTVVVVGALSIVGLALSTVPVAPPVAAVPFVFAIVGAVVRGARVWAFAMAAAALTIPVISFVLTTEPLQALRSIGDVVIVLVAAGLGEGVRVRRGRIAAVRAAAEERRRTEAERERLRIARELHDVLAHSLSSISVQAGVGLHLIETNPQQAAASLAAIKATSRTALDDVRTVLGILRADGEVPRAPEPDLAAIETLVTDARAGGLRIRYDDGAGGGGAGGDAGRAGVGPGEPLDPVVPRPVQLAAYRIVQEALTNAGRYAAGSTVHVSVRLDGTGSAARFAEGSATPLAEGSAGRIVELVVSVVDDGGSRGPASPTSGEGRGILGMRERASLLGGSLVAEPRAAGFAVVARLPVGAEPAGPLGTPSGVTT